MLPKDFYWFSADLTDHTRMFKDHQDFITWVNLLGWKSGIRPKEVCYGEADIPIE